MATFTTSTNMVARIPSKNVLSGHTGQVTCVAVSANQPGLVVSGSRDKTVLIWNTSDVAPGEAVVRPTKQLSQHGGYVSSIDISPSAPLMITGSWDKTMRLWDLETMECVRTFIGNDEAVLSVKFSPSGNQIISGSADCTQKIWEVNSNDVATLDKSQNTAWVTKALFSPSNTQYIVSCDWDGMVKVYDLETLNLQYTFDHAAESNHVGCTLNDVDISPDGSLACSGGSNRVLHIWSLYKGEASASIKCGSPINACQFSPVKYAVAVATDEGMSIWDLSTEQQIAAAESISDSETVSPWMKQATCVAWAPDGETIYVGSGDHNVYSYNTSIST